MKTNRRHEFFLLNYVQYVHYLSFHHKLASDVPLLPQDQASSQPKTNKPNVQRVMNLLQQLQQQSQSSVDLPDLVQQLLRRNGDTFNGTEQKQATLSKCRSFTEGACPEIKDEQQRALVAQLKVKVTLLICPIDYYINF